MDCHGFYTVGQSADPKGPIITMELEHHHAEVVYIEKGIILNRATHQPDRLSHDESR